MTVKASSDLSHKSLSFALLSENVSIVSMCKRKQVNKYNLLIEEATSNT